VGLKYHFPVDNTVDRLAVAILAVNKLIITRGNEFETGPVFESVS
jgi:hypothetical protein